MTSLYLLQSLILGGKRKRCCAIKITLKDGDRPTNRKFAQQFFTNHLQFTGHGGTLLPRVSATISIPPRKQKFTVRRVVGTVVNLIDQNGTAESRPFLWVPLDRFKACPFAAYRTWHTPFPCTSNISGLQTTVSSQNPM